MGIGRVGRCLKGCTTMVCFRTTFLTIFIDDIDEEVFCEIFKFFDDTKIASRVNTLNGVKSMQRTLEKLVAWVKNR